MYCDDTVVGDGHTLSHFNDVHPTRRDEGSGSTRLFRAIARYHQVLINMCVNP